MAAHLISKDAESAPWHADLALQAVSHALAPPTGTPPRFPARRLPPCWNLRAARFMSRANPCGTPLGRGWVY